MKELSTVHGSFTWSNMFFFCCVLLSYGDDTLNGFATSPEGTSVCVRALRSACCREVHTGPHSDRSGFWTRMEGHCDALWWSNPSICFSCKSIGRQRAGGKCAIFPRLDQYAYTMISLNQKCVLLCDEFCILIGCFISSVYIYIYLYIYIHTCL